ncbi:ABC transporter substrate-binding protein [Streptomyces sp. NA04227]|uniref:ABC transporter substrate-binding protein n=1 Tax=Streptomyces sp. NA04227 TaxID=2742136 RepID=UPI00159003EB|nr:ABC transporter substrate-binding protein [Streptomyces sp. NA04227]QKW08952.1 ABC transporter substrate-binding protein [Streptomyces sp. NA04227]
MSIIRSRTAQAAVVAATAGALVLTGCSDGGGSAKDKSKSKKDAAAQSVAVKLGTAADSKGPAAEVPGAKTGGTMKVYNATDFSHLDPGQIYVSDAGMLGKLLFRGLTTNKEDAKGNQTVVGDIATDSGQTTDGGKTWKYTLKDGIKDENGHVIDSADVRHSVERLYDPFITDGPSYLQQWLSGSGTTYRKAYAGPFKGKHLPDSVLETPDKKTVIFKFKTAQPDLPQALAMVGYSVVPKETDTKEKYDKKPVAVGPYKIGEYKPGKGMKLVRNENWDPKTDAMRHAYVDGFDIEYNHNDDDQTKTLLADRGDAKDAVMFTGQVSTSQLQKVVGNAAAMKRTIQGYAPYVWQMNFNLDRIKDKKIRDAITLAMPATAVYKADGGAYGGEVANSLMSPTTPGYDEKLDPFNRAKNPNGDIEAAKKLIEEAGAKGKKITYAHGSEQMRQEQAVLIEDALRKIGLNPQKKQVDSATFYEQVGKIKNKYDIYMTGWGQDWASGATVFPPLFDGTQIQDGSSNYSHLNDEHVNKEIVRIQKITDPKKAATAWHELNEYIMTEINPAAPIYYTKVFQIAGSNVGGLRYSTTTSYTDVTQVYLKK